MNASTTTLMSTLPSYEQALARAVEAAQPLGQAETSPLNSALGRILAEDVRADRDYPPFNRATMDGYAVNSSQLGQFESFDVVGSVPAGHPGNIKVREGEVVRIATGAPVPEGLDAVIQHELSDRGEPVRFTIDHVETWANIHRRGEDTHKNSTVLQHGTRLGAQDLGILATVGCAHVPVVRRPVVCILTSGDEIRHPEERDLEPHQIRNAGHIMLGAAVGCMGGEVHCCRHVVDNLEHTQRGVAHAAGEADVIVSVGGISAGERDFFAAAYESHGAHEVIHGVSIKPGKPVYIAQLTGHRAQLIVALPGNPVSVLVTAHLFLWPIIRKLLGIDPTLPWEMEDLAESVRATGARQSFRPVRRTADGRSVEVLRWAGSGDLIHTAASDGIVELPMREGDVTAGTRLRFLPWSWRS